MDHQENSDSKNKLPALFVNLIEETIEVALHKEVNLCQEFVKNNEKWLTDYVNNSNKQIGQKSIIGFLFESLSASNDAKEILESFAEETDPKVFYEELSKFNSKALKILNIDLEPEKAKKTSVRKIVDGFQEWIKKYKYPFRKKPINEKQTECYPYFHLIHTVLQSHLDKLGNIEKKRLDILINLWEKNKIIDKNIEILSKNKYVLEDGENEFELALNFADTNKLIEDYAEEVRYFIKAIKADINSTFDNLEKDQLNQVENSEKSKGKYTVESVIRASKAIEKEFKSARSKWHNTLLVVTDDWGLDREISSLKFQILRGYFGFIQYVNSKLKNPLDEKMKSISDFTEEQMVLFKPTEESHADEIIGKIKKNKLDFKRKLVLRLIPEIKSILLNSELPKEVDEFEKNTSKQFNSLSKSKLLIKSPVYDRPIDRLEMQKISPYDLVSFDMQPEFMEVFPSLKNALIRQLQVLQEKLDEIPEIVDFSIDSAIGYYEDKKDLSEALKIGGEGIKRATNKIEDLTALRNDFYTTEVDFMKDKIDQLFNKISEITDNENALQIKIRVTKAKAVEQSKAVRDRLIRNIKNFLPRIIDKIQILYKFLIESSIKIRKQFEGEVTKTFITSDVSDYLVETEEAVNRLPFVYQRLYKLEPLSTFDLYIEREEAFEKFKRAYSRWKSGKFAPVVISGEKGSGKTSFINRFLASKSIGQKIIFHDLHKEYLEPEVAYDQLCKNINDFLVEQKDNNLGNSKKIVVIDGLEKLFEAKINGFNVLQKTMQLISKTNSQIFWIVACHLYSYKYLERSFNIAEYFGYHIELEDLKTADLIKIIEKRHNISGFRLKFLPDAQKKSLIPMVKQTDKSDQLELRGLYFERLQKIVKGNITQAFLYWMRSAAEVTEDIIYINTQGDTRLDFIRSISLSKFEILKNILIHNGISSNKHSEIFRIPFEKSELQLEQMLDDGIIIKQSKFYNINPMIYKQVIDQMYKLNLLH